MSEYSGNRQTDPTNVFRCLAGFLAVGLLIMLSLLWLEATRWENTLSSHDVFLIVPLIFCLFFVVIVLFKCKPTDFRIKTLLVFTALLWTFLIGELGFRILINYIRISSYEATLNVISRIARGPVVRPKPYVMYIGTKSIQGNNNLGFHDLEREFKKKDGTTRIAALGGSTTKGRYNYPSKLQAILSANYPNKYEVLNFGMNGWTTAESLINYALLVKEFRPDIVLIHHAINDAFPRLYKRMKPDYSHFRNVFCEHCIEQPLKDIAFLRSFKIYAYIRNKIVPVEKNINYRELLVAHDDPSNPYLNPLPYLTKKPRLYLNPRTDIFARNLRSLIDIISGDGAVPVLVTQPFSKISRPSISFNWTLNIRERAVTSHNEAARFVADEKKVLLIDLDEQMTGREEYFTDPIHCTENGRKRKAELIFHSLMVNGLLK